MKKIEKAFALNTWGQFKEIYEKLQKLDLEDDVPIYFSYRRTGIDEDGYLTFTYWKDDECEQIVIDNE